MKLDFNFMEEVNYQELPVSPEELSEWKGLKAKLV